ncbi:hypothetical protein [Bdellovibrio svalbardensis]|uniref:Uncharacterized protein n=1 Tax=Bdellovibrio svalbardensis TaxID=2972972 RepID=A0ABT6DJ49_9BACT|nr:hypothetical protein [Bdellovibrio svalbardensis]MDG0815944.1 hypothetical protein [Bdellovibrio svalbardensis]
MARNHFLNLYVIRVALNAHRAFIPFEMVIDRAGQAKDFYDVAREFLNNISTFHQDDEDETVIEAATANVDYLRTQRKIKGFLSAGSYGYEGKMINTANGVKSPIPAEHAPAFDHYFELFLPPGGERGVLALHAIGNRGCKTMFHNAFKDFLVAQYPHLKIDIRPLKLDFQEDAERFHNHFRVEKIKRRAYVPRRVEDRNAGGGRVEEQIIVETEVRIGRSIHNPLINFDNLIQAEDPSVPVARLFRRYVDGREIENSTFDVTIDMDGQKKTVRMGQEIKFDMSFDISADVNRDMRRRFSLAGMARIVNQYIEHAIGQVV